MKIIDSNEKFVGPYFCLTFVKTRGHETIVSFLEMEKCL